VTLGKSPNQNVWCVWNFIT